MVTVEIDRRHFEPRWISRMSDGGMVFTSKYCLKNDVHDWLTKNCTGIWNEDHCNSAISFRRETDAVAFKMFWIR